MRKINRNIDLALIVTFLVVFFYAKIGFALPEYALRPNLISSYNGGGERLNRAARYLSDRALVLNNQGLLSQLGEQKRRVLTYIFIEGKTGKETAEIMGITQPIVSRYKQLALAMLRELVSPGSDYQVVLNNQGLLSQLSEQQRKVLTYIFIEGKTGIETAGIMGITPEAVSIHKQLALARLRELSGTMPLVTISTVARESI
jgi:DNA-directed RNA polymerase specialized sigma24 family protein